MKTTKKAPKILAVDVDGTLTNDICFTQDECKAARVSPLGHRLIERMERESRTNLIVIYTARKDRLIPATLSWLRKNNIPFDAISNNKMPADLYIDDRSENPFREISVKEEDCTC
jgi:uncharacterized HAD superfamily protein